MFVDCLVCDITDPESSDTNKLKEGTASPTAPTVHADVLNVPMLKLRTISTANVANVLFLLFLLCAALCVPTHRLIQQVIQPKLHFIPDYSGCIFKTFPCESFLLSFHQRNCFSQHFSSAAALFPVQGCKQDRECSKTDIRTWLKANHNCWLFILGLMYCCILVSFSVFYYVFCFVFLCLLCILRVLFWNLFSSLVVHCPKYQVQCLDES